MTDNPTPEAAMVEVTQADREAAAEFVFGVGICDPTQRPRWSELGEGLPIVQAFARHRLAVSPPPVTGGQGALREAAQAVLDRMSSTYKARNGRDVGIESDDGEKCWIVHSDDIETLRRGLATPATGGTFADGERVLERAENILRQGAAQLEARAVCPADTRMAEAMRTNAAAIRALQPGAGREDGA